MGKGSSSVFVASDIPALLPYTRDVIRLKDGDAARIYKDGIEIIDRSGRLLEAEVERITWDADAAEKGGYTHFMLKEIHEQPRAIRETISGRISEIDGDVRLSLGISEEEIRSLERVSIIACGTSYHAGMLAKTSSSALPACRWMWRWPLSSSIFSSVPEPCSWGSLSPERPLTPSWP